MNIIIVLVSLLLLLLFLYGLFKKYKILMYLSGFGILLIIFWVMYNHFFKKDVLNFLFTNDAENVLNKPEMYCGDNADFDHEIYDVMGTRNKCLKKGVGIGMTLPDSQRDEFMAKEYVPNPDVKLYCGDKEDLPAGYSGFATKTQCLRKGVGIGLIMPQEKRRSMQERPVRELGKREIIDLARRLKINVNDMSRERAIITIMNEMFRLNLNN